MNKITLIVFVLALLNTAPSLAESSWVGLYTGKDKKGNPCYLHITNAKQWHDGFNTNMKRTLIIRTNLARFPHMDYKVESVYSLMVTPETLEDEKITIYTQREHRGDEWVDIGPSSVEVLKRGWWPWSTVKSYSCTDLKKMGNCAKVLYVADFKARS